MDDVEQNLANWKHSLMRSIPLEQLIPRNPTAYKWKGLFRVWMLRETVYWRLQDVLEQSYMLYQKGHLLGARILLRSGFETLAVLIYLNQHIEQVLEGKLDFHDFDEKTGRLMLGSKNKSTPTENINIVTVLKQVEKRYRGIEALYGHLSESAHPSWEGLGWGYSKVDHDTNTTNFSNRWGQLHGGKHLDEMRKCMEVFHHEYNDVWPSLVTRLETWTTANDAHLEATKKAPTSD